MAELPTRDAGSGPDAAAAAARILESLRGSRGTVELLVVSDSDGRAAGARMLVRPDAVEGSLLSLIHI